MLLRREIYEAMIEVLKSYLVQNRSISIPGFGTILVDRLPAQSDIANRSIRPPVYQFRFDKYFDAPDKDFFTFLAAQKQIADFEAIKIYNEWAYEFRNRIRAEQSVVWDGVGVLQQDASGEILFEPAETATPHLFPVKAERVIRTDAAHAMIVGDKETTSTRMTEYLSEESPRKTNRWVIAAVIIALVAMALIFFRFNIAGFTIEATSNQQKVNTR